MKSFLAPNGPLKKAQPRESVAIIFGDLWAITTEISYGQTEVEEPDHAESRVVTASGQLEKPQKAHLMAQIRELTGRFFGS